MKKKKSGSLIVISGPSGVGKDTICNELVRKHNEICLSISMTTRERWKGYGYLPRQRRP